MRVAHCGAGLGPLVKYFTDCSRAVLLLMLSRLFIAALRSPYGNRLTSWLLFVMFIVILFLSIWYPGTGVVLDCMDS